MHGSRLKSLLCVHHMSHHFLLLISQLLLFTGTHTDKLVTLHPALIQGESEGTMYKNVPLQSPNSIILILLLRKLSHQAKTVRGNWSIEISHIRLAKFQSKMFSVGIGMLYPISFLLTVTKAGSSGCKMSLKAPEGDDKEDEASILQ